ncbi:hypothetical protein BD289DRAFT_432134 [Coniella lustricola]|uniref:Uncharacterized protein n=1 Tax=Coniella lustricola TaxID=2025994 RepID=A0A2T3AA12_9PEZI|nr:hypothetical protein BD289DRAFT_432134 [Coniella lustricola]
MIRDFPSSLAFSLTWLHGAGITDVCNSYTRRDVVWQLMWITCPNRYSRYPGTHVPCPANLHLIKPQHHRSTASFRVTRQILRR